MAVRRGVRNQRLFGSVARGDHRETSDMDLLVDLDGGVNLLDLIGLKRELTELLRCGAGEWGDLANFSEWLAGDSATT